jgi:hypothetical protein
MGAIVGTIVDSSGGVVPGASVKVRHISTGAVIEARTNGAGAYTLPSLSIGEYTVTVTASGFKTTEQAGIRIVAGVTSKIEFQLELGQPTQTVQVTAMVARVDTSTTTTGTTRVTEEMSELRILMQGGNRGILSLLRTLPGVPPNLGPDNPFNSQGIETSPINGSPGGGQSYTVDGVRGNVSAHGQIRDDFQPPPEMVAEMRVISAGSSEYGWNSGVGVALVFKSGTNTLHGNLFEYLRNDALDSRSFFAQNRSVNKQNEFGFTLGGPVVIPKVYNGKNKTLRFI